MNTVNFKTKEWLGAMGFVLKDGVKNSYFKTFKNYEISIVIDDENIKKSVINYGRQIKIHRNTTTNFSKQENLVVLECVNRLLSKGYEPDSIELEKSWNLGHKGKGFLDILIKDKSKVSLFMIECKTWGEEFNKEKNKMFKDGGQLLSYFRQDKKPKALCLYTSKLKDNEIHYTNEIIDTETLKGENETEIFDSWSKSFLTKGIFEPHVEPYSFKTKGLIYDDLEDLEKFDGTTIFNQFAEILRRNVVSDKTNAFNKIFNLFICKIYDEDQKAGTQEELQFQCKSGENYEQIFDKLNILYKNGLKQYISIIVPDISEEQLNELIQNQDNETLKEEFRNLRYYRSSQEFAFKDVYNKETFEDNAVIVKEVIELLQKFKIKYSNKHQHLGDFFELLLNTGIKQESGQFFTPIPITKFICKSLPIDKIIQNKNKIKELCFLPFVIDYSSGSGHFITEMMDEIDSYVRRFDEKDIKAGRKAQEEFHSERNNIKWAKKYIYAIEKDYRLVKISKISSFLNGDGDANVISGDGLAPFNSKKFTGILNKKEFNKENNVFDIVVANPPYSVSGFAKSSFKEYEKLKLDPLNAFDLYKYLSDQSSEIECLFIERTKQLLKEQGVAGIILPISIFTNGGIYEKTREILFKNFVFKGIVSLGNQAFMATGTKTIIAFLQKRNPNDYIRIEREVDKFLNGGFVDIVINEIENVFSTYIREVYEDLNFENYCDILKGETIKHELSKEYKNLEIKQIKEIEKQKLIYFILSYPQQIVIAESGEKDTEKNFYGFEFSNRRGHEGIHIYKNEEGYLQSKLYSESEIDIRDEQKLNTYILKNFEDCKNLASEINKIQNSESHPLKDHIHYVRLSNLMTFDLKRFDKAVNLNKITKIKIETKWKLAKLGDECEIISGVTYDKKLNISRIETNYKVLTADNISFDNKLNLNIDKTIYLDDTLQKKDDAKLRQGDIFICTSSGSKQHIGKCCYIDQDFGCYAGGFMSIIRNYKNVEGKYLLQILNLMKNIGLFANLSVGNNINNLSSKLKDLKFPLPPKEIQKKIIMEISEIEKKEKEIIEKIAKMDLQIEKLSNTFTSKTVKKLSNISLLIKRGKSPQYGFSNIQIIKSGQVRGMYFFDFNKKFYVSDNFLLDERKLQKGDLLINSTGVGTAGRVNLFVLDGDYVVDSHITIVRLDQNMVLPKFVLYQLRNIGFQNIEKMANGQSGQIELSKETIENIILSIPTLSEQQKIISQIEPLEEEIEHETNFLGQVKDMKQTILDKHLK